MKLKTIFGIILGVVAVGLTSCSSDLTNGENTAVNPNETAKRTLSLSTDKAKTRSEVNLTTGNKWETGDRSSLIISTSMVQPMNLVILS